MRRLAIAAVLFTVCLSAPLAAQGEPGKFNRFELDPASAKPNEWVSAKDPYVAYSAIGGGVLNLGDFGGTFSHALGSVGPGYMGIRFAVPAGYWWARYLSGIGATVTFRGFLDGHLVDTRSRVMDQQIRAISYDPGTAFDYLEISVDNPLGSDPEVMNETAWINAEAFGVTTTPEPISMTLLGTGLAGVAVARRRRKRQQDAAAE